MRYPQRVDFVDIESHRTAVIAHSATETLNRKKFYDAQRGKRKLYREWQVNVSKNLVVHCERCGYTHNKYIVPVISRHDAKQLKLNNSDSTTTVEALI